MFRVTTLDLAKPPRNDQGEVDFAQDFFGKPAFLTVSGQLEAEIFACALGKVYTFGPTFRAENSNTLAAPGRVLDGRAGDGLLRPRTTTWTWPRRSSSASSATCWSTAPRTCSSSTSASSKTAISTLEGIVDSEFVRAAVHRGGRASCRSPGKTFEFPVTWGIDLQAEHERYPDREALQEAGDPVRLPARRSSRSTCGVNDDGKTVRAMDVLVPRRRRDHRRQPARGAARRARSAHEGAGASTRRRYWWYLDLRRYGTVPHAGFGLGLERTVQFVTGMANIRDVIPFPRTPGNAEF